MLPSRYPCDTRCCLGRGWQLEPCWFCGSFHSPWDSCQVRNRNDQSVCWNMQRTVLLCNLKAYVRRGYTRFRLWIWPKSSNAPLWNFYLEKKRPRFSHCSKTVSSNYIPLDFTDEKHKSQMYFVFTSRVLEEGFFRMLQITLRLPVCTFECGFLLTDTFLSYEYSGCFTPVMRGLQACTVKFEQLQSSETDHVTPLFHSSPMANLISGLLQVFHSSKLQKQQKLMSLLNMKLSVQAFVSACSPRVFFFFGPLWSPQWIISLNVLHHYIHEPPLKPPPPFLLHHWPFLTTFSSQNFSLAVLCTSWFINSSIHHPLFHSSETSLLFSQHTLFTC